MSIYKGSLSWWSGNMYAFFQTDNPKVDWSHTYHSAVEIYPIPGFDKDIRLQVKLRMIEKKLLELEVSNKDEKQIKVNRSGWQL